MLCRIKYCDLNYLFVSKLMNRCFAFTYCRNMSTVTNMKEDLDTVCNNKRHITDNDNDVLTKVQKLEEANTNNVVQRVKRKNYVMMLCYLGKNYHGMQKNPNTKTIEEDLLTALLKADLITQEIFDNIREINFQRAARTDKGVSAVRQIVSLKLPETVDKEEINKHLPQEIRVFGLKRVTKHFNSKIQCSARTYRYVVPTFAFAPEDPSFVESKEELTEEERIKQLSDINGKPYTEFRLSPELLDRINTIAKSFEGTHNFHNFTSKIRPSDPSAYRYIISCSCINTFISNDMEFAIIEIKGQSFMLHQIRKMVAVLIGIARNIVTDDIINEMYKHDKICAPVAPSLGLSLNYVHYDRYNKRYGNDGIHEILEWKECDEEIEKFQKEYILKHVIDTEIAEKTVFMWLANVLAANKFILKYEEDAAT